MSLSELDLKRCERVLARFMEKRRPPAHIRDQVTKRESPFAKATYVRTRNLWRVFWMRRDLKWHGYEPTPEVRTLEEFVDVVDRDEWACFFG
jgi:hypothetical protein